MSEKKMAKSTDQVRSLHFKEASIATFLRRGYLLTHLKMKSFPVVAKRKSLFQSGFGNKPNATLELTEEEQEKHFETG